ncbi:hypothetical protein LR48_Vigan07g032300 [Vigna angularis]|uniref:Bifunctional inhibitor/plant lipid transfer protein/seed storage helical domain-containing protein n=1 Tax=Phaseolus angularis TaxID=3914 RepID=A0A0L9UVQ4_PHAAN|nr:hypothetical protein LR48_Vigan07g032300 [Vigna angularis]
MKPVNAFSCVEAKLSLLACLPFLTSSQDSPSSICCNAVSNVRASAPTKPEFVRHVYVSRQPLVNFLTLIKIEPFNFLNYVTLMSVFLSPRTSTVTRSLFEQEF